MRWMELELRRSNSVGGCREGCVDEEVRERISIGGLLTEVYLEIGH